MNHLLKELRLNTKTSCTVDEAVGMMLGVWGVDCFFDEELLCGGGYVEIAYSLLAAVWSYIALFF